MRHTAFHLFRDRPETPPKPSFNIPFSRDVDFIERGTILNQIHRACRRPGSRVALVGLGGIGKSQLAIEYAYRVRDRAIRENREVWVFWVHAETRARVEEGFKSIADAVKIPGRNQPEADIPQLVYQWLQNERNGQWLMVLDSADDIDVFYNTQEIARQTTSEGEIKPLSAYLPQSSNGSILATTRNKHLAYRLTGSYYNIIDVGPMGQEHALALLAKKSGESADMDTAANLVEALEYMPLAISQAAAYIQRTTPRTSISKYLEQFRKSEQKRSGLLNHDYGDLRRDESAKNSVITTWQITFDHIRLKRPSAAELLCLMSFFDRESISRWLVQPLNQTQNSRAETDNASISSTDSADGEFEKDIKILRDYCLVRTNEEGDAFEMYGLVQLSIRKWLDINGESEKFKRQFINRMVKAFPLGDFKNWDTCQKLFPHAEKALEYRLEERELQKESQDMRKTVLGPEHPDTLISMGNLALTYSSRRRWKEAELLGVQVMDMSKTVLGPDHPDTLTSMANLALIYWHQGMYTNAESLSIQVIGTRKMTLGPDHPDTLTSMANLALIYWHQGLWKDAESLSMQVIGTRKTVLGSEHPNTLTSMANLALIYMKQGRWKEAELLGVQVMGTQKRVLGPQHPDTVTSMANLAVIYRKQGQRKEAESLEAHVAAMREAIAGLVKDPESGIRGALQGYEKAWDPKQGINYESEASLGDIPRVDIMGGKIGMQSERMFHDSAIGSSITQESTKQVAGPDVEALSEGMPTVDEVNEELECATVYTQTSNDSTGQVVQNYEKNLVDRLCHDLSLRTANEADVARVSNSLPHVLQVFAFKIAKEGKGRNYRSTMRFMLKHRRSIANQLASKARESSETSDSVERQENPYTRSPSPGMSYEDKVRGWHPTHSMHDPNMPLEPEETKPEPSLADEVRNKENQESELKDVFSELVADSRAYEWLLARLRGELTQVIPAEATRPRLSEAILRELHGAAIFSRTSTPRCIDVLFNVEWSPHSFFKEQEYGVPPEEAVVKALVLVGTTTQSEGLACGEYLLRQWPESAPTFIRLVQSVVKSAEDTSHKEKLNDGTTLQAAAKDGRFMLEADGHPDTVIEIGEQLMWISCALRSSDFADVGTCEPSFGDILTTSRSPSKVVMRIELTNKLKHDKLNESQSGACWKDLFRSPLLVEGYPIPLRCTESALGLQLSLSTLMALVPDSRLVPYMGKLFIKRFATLLVAVKRLGDIILWHAISNKDGSYIYYHDERVRLHEIDVGSSLLREVDMGELKHVVGWTSNAENVAGTSSGNYRVLPSSLQPYRPLELEVERFTVGVSKYVVANSSIKLGLRDRPITMRAGEDEKGDIKHISKCFVVLYDVKDHRGFLLDGATALLHLVRTSIVDDQEDGLIDNLIDGRTVNDSIQLDNNSDIRRRAMKTLLNNENALLKLYEVSPKEEIKIESKTVCEVPNTPKTTTEEIDSQRKSWVRFKHRVTAIWWMLDQAINYSTDNTALKAKIKILEGKKVLEGYDFMDFALCGTSQAKLRSISPMSHSEGWLEAVRDLPAVTLFGRGFGDVIKHKVSTNAAHYMCSDWRDVPKGCGYLAMSSATLERVLEYGDPKAWKLQDPFQPCRSEDRNCDRRHFLVDDQNNTAQEDRMTFPKHGAVIVGHKRHKQSVLQAITHRIGRHVDSSYEISIASQTSVTQQPSWDTQFADMSQPTASSSSSAAAENKCIRENTTSDTVTDTSQNDVQRSTAMEAQRPSALLAVPIITHSKATTPSEVNTESGPSKRPRPVDLSRTDAITVNANNQAGPRISISSSRTQTEAGVVQPSTTPMVTTLSGASAKAEPSKRSQPATMINADNNHEVPQIPKSPSCNQNEGEVVQSSTATAAGPLPCAGQTLPNSTNSQIALQGQKRPIFYLFKTWAKKPRPWISKRRPS